MIAKVPVKVVRRSLSIGSLALLLAVVSCLAQNEWPAPSRSAIGRASQADVARQQQWLAEMEEGAIAEQRLLAKQADKSESRTSLLYVVNGKPARFPLTSSEKFGLAVRDVYDPFGLVGEAGQALINQAEGTPRDFGGGMLGYSKRFGAVVGTDAAGEFFGTWMFPSIFRTDPRYFRMARGNPGKRAAYALTRILITRKDSGGNTFNWANFLSGFATTSISNLYYPHRNRDLGPTLEHATINIGYDALDALFREFWPDIAHLLHVPPFVIRRTADPVFPKSQQPVSESPQSSPSPQQ